MKPCYGREVYEQFLAGQLPQAEEQALADHAADCAACQEALRNLLNESSAPDLPTLPIGSGRPVLDADFLTRLRQARPDPPGEPPLPKVEGYDVLGILGRGGMGTVYRARHLRLGRSVALKFPPLPENLTGDEELRLRREAMAVAALKHPNIVQIHEIGEHEGRPFLCLEFCPAGSLAARLRACGGVLPPREAARVIEVLAGALSYAHQKGIIHRDLKPSNILLDGEPGTPLEDCVLKVADFGLAKRLEGASAATQSGVILGTPDYMAPEQAQEGETVGPAADIYALGVMLYEMLTGQTPFKDANIAEKLLRIVKEPAKPPSRLQPRLSRDLDTICLKCLEKEPAERYADAQALAEDLRRFLNGEAILARPPSLWRRTGRRLRRHRIALAVGTVLAAASLGAWAWVDHTLSGARQTRASLRLSLRDAVREFDDGTILSRDRARVYEDLQNKVALYETIFPAASSDPADREELADVYVRLGWLEGVYGDKARAASLIERARTIFTELSAARPESASAAAKRANACNDLGLLAVLRTHHEEARPLYEEAIRLRKQLTADFPGEKAHVLSLALDWSALGELLQALPDRAGAEAAFARASRLTRKYVGGEPNHIGTDSLLAGSLMRWGASCDALGSTDQADRAFDEALALLDRAFKARRVAEEAQPRPGADHYLSAWGGPRRSNTFYEFLQFTTTEREAIVQKMVDHYASRTSAKPGDTAGKRKLARSHYYLATIGFAGGRGLRDSLAAARRGAALYDDLCRTNPGEGAFALEAAQLSCHTAILLLSRDDEEGARWCERGLSLLDTAVLGDDLSGDAKLIRSDLLLCRARVRIKKEMHLDALRDLEAAFRHDPAARARPPATELYPMTVARARHHLVVDLQRRGRHAAAMAEADALANLPNMPGEALYDGACVFGVAAGVEQDPTRREEYARRCIRLLRMAFAAGFGKDPLQKATGIFGDPVQHMDGDKDLIAVHDREDYRRLRAELTRRP